VHGIVAGGGLLPDGESWVACKPGFFLPVRVLSRLFRGRFVAALAAAHHAGQLQFFGEYASLSDAKELAAWLAPLRQQEWVVYAKRPFAGPEAVLAYLARRAHRVAISNSRLVAPPPTTASPSATRTTGPRAGRLHLAGSSQPRADVGGNCCSWVGRGAAVETSRLAGRVPCNLAAPTIKQRWRSGIEPWPQD